MSYTPFQVKLFRDPVRAALMNKGIYHGIGPIKDSFVPISPGERDRLLEVLEREAEDLVCTGCGSTKTERWLKAMGAISCCDARHMVKTTDILNELTDLRKPKRRAKKVVSK